jgi:hypothetical protein
MQRPELSLPRDDGAITCFLASGAVPPDPNPLRPVATRRQLRVSIDATRNPRAQTLKTVARFHEKAASIAQDFLYSFTDFFGSHLYQKARPVGGSEVDLRILQSWIGLCEKRHAHTCSRPGWLRRGQKQLPTNLRVIDVRSRCIIKAPPHCRYYALSYVWGMTETIKLTVANEQQLEIPGAFNYDEVGNLPLTISDAIHLVKRLGERYLWVDALCIVQDDEHDKLAQIAQMDQIYSLAVITIVAAHGNDANAGLPGVAPGSRRSKQHAVQINGLSLLSTTVSSGLGPTYWDRRGWTYQERALSKRLLVFAADQVFFFCKRAGWREDTIFEVDMSYQETVDRLDFNFNDMAYSVARSPFEEYVEVVEEYASRDLSYESDALHAFAGVMGVLSQKLECQFLWGLPERYLDAALLWTPGARNARRGCTTSVLLADGSTKELPFPSWSWTGWTGSTWYDSDDIERVFDQCHRPEITWYSRSIHGELHRLRGLSDQPGVPKANWKGEDELQGIAVPSSTSFISSGVLTFWTSSAFLDIALDSGKRYIRNAEMCDFQLVPSENSVLLETKWVEEHPGPYEFIVISRNVAVEGEDALNLMLIERDSDGVACRVAIAVYPEEEWIKKERAWKQIVLA